MNLKKIMPVAALMLAFTITGCSLDGDGPELIIDPFENILAPSYEIDTYRVLPLAEDYEDLQGVEFSWSVNGEVVSTDPTFYFNAEEAGVYEITMKVNNGVDEPGTYTTHVTVHEPAVPYNRDITEVLEYNPAPGQFINATPKFEEGDDAASMLAKASELILKGTPVSLGGFGGSVTLKFDHTVINKEGADFKVLGNASTFGNPEPGVILVAWDKNGNGLPDEDEWYEIAGSEYAKDSTVKNYRITYHKPSAEDDAAAGKIAEYIPWEDNQGGSGFLEKNAFHRQSYYPLWADSETLTFMGTKMADNYSGSGAIFTAVPYEYGYADNGTNNSEVSNIDISWAVDKDGKQVKLPGIDFIKIYTGIRQEAGMTGEVSTDVQGAYDLHFIPKEN